MAEYILNLLPVTEEEKAAFQEAAPRAVHVCAGRRTVTAEQLLSLIHIYGGGLPSPAPPIQGAAGGGGRPGGAGEKRRGRRDGQGWEKLDRNRAGGAVSIRRDRGGSGVQGAGGTAGRSGRAEDGPVRPPTGGG